MDQSASPPIEDVRARLLALTDACVLCGLCLPHCPTYALDAVETESPRGRIMLVQAQAAGSGPLEASAQRALDHCLGCGRCEQVCPAKVRYGEILRLSRSLSPPSARPLAVRALRWAGRHPRWLARLLLMARAAPALAPPPMRRWLQAAGTPVETGDSESTSTKAGPGLRIGLLTGCVARPLDAQVQRATIRLLAAAGHEVVVASGQVCCGALPAHEGALIEARADAARNRAVWSESRPDLLVSTASGCHAAFASTLAGVAPVRDICEFLAEDSAFAKLELRRIDARVAVHLPCTQRALPTSVDALRSLLRRVPGLDWRELPDSGCCGAAGTHQLRFPERADAFRQPLVVAALADGASTLLTSNIGCRLHMQAAHPLSAMRILHPAQLLAEALP